MGLRRVAWADWRRGAVPIGVAALAATVALGSLPRAAGYLSGSVANPANMVVDPAKPLVRCTQPYRLDLAAVLPSSLSGDYFECTDNYNVPVTLDWSIVAVDPPTAGIHVSGSGILAAGETDACKPVTLSADALALPGTYTLTYRGTTAASAAFFASVQFSGQVAVTLLPANPASCKG